MRTTATIENESDQNSRSEGSPTHEVHMHTGALLIICRRLSSSREESSPLSVSLSFSFYLLSLLSLLSHSRSRVLSFLLFHAYNLASLSLFLYLFIPFFLFMPNDQSYLLGCIGDRDAYNLRIEFRSLVYLKVPYVLWTLKIYRPRSSTHTLSLSFSSSFGYDSEFPNSTRNFEIYLADETVWNSRHIRNFRREPRNFERFRGTL